VHILPASSNTLHGNRWPVCMVSNECHYRTLRLDSVWAWLTSARIAMNGSVQPRLVSSLVVKEGSLPNAQYLPARLLTNCLFEHGDQWGALPIFVEPTNEIHTELPPLIKYLAPILLSDLCYLRPRDAFTALQVTATLQCHGPHAVFLCLADPLWWSLRAFPQHPPHWGVRYLLNTPQVSLLVSSRRLLGMEVRDSCKILPTFQSCRLQGPSTVRHSLISTGSPRSGEDENSDVELTEGLVHPYVVRRACLDASHCLN
jgi:hypothetical protein